jgi:hypothetical protein
VSVRNVRNLSESSVSVGCRVSEMSERPLRSRTFGRTFGHDYGPRFARASRLWVGFSPSSVIFWRALLRGAVMCGPAHAAVRSSVRSDLALEFVRREAIEVDRRSRSNHASEGTAKPVRVIVRDAIAVAEVTRKSPPDRERQPRSSRTDKLTQVIEAQGIPLRQQNPAPALVAGGSRFESRIARITREVC